MVDAKRYIHVDEHGVYRVAGTQVPLDSLVYAFDQGHSPETIQEQYPVLNLEQIYGAITYYLANQGAVHQYLTSQDKIWDEERRKSQAKPSPLLERLRAARAAVSRVGALASFPTV
jgi:uncharacterized protein (DUF433 family)